MCLENGDGEEEKNPGRLSSASRVSHREDRHPYGREGPAEKNGNSPEYQKTHFKRLHPASQRNNIRVQENMLSFILVFRKADKPKRTSWQLLCSTEDASEGQARIILIKGITIPPVL